MIAINSSIANSAHTLQPNPVLKLKQQSDAQLLDDLVNKQVNTISPTKVLSKSLQLTTKDIISRINEFLTAANSKKIEELAPEDHTAEKTAERIVNQVEGMFAAYAKSNSNKNPEEIVKSFITAARKGIDSGYQEAYELLESFGAFEVSSVKSEVEKTKEILTQKLQELEERLYGKLDGKIDKSQNNTNVKLPLSAESTGQLDVFA